MTKAVVGEFCLIYVFTQFKINTQILYGGATGMGKSVALQVLILSAIWKNPSQKVNIIIFDIGANDLDMFDGIQHLSHPIVKDEITSVYIIGEVVKEMERRIKLSIDELRELPAIILVIDEIVSLLKNIQYKELFQKFSNAMTNLLRRGHHAKIHIVIGTQDPTKENLKIASDNITARVAFRCNNHYSSQVVIGQSGAENLEGKGSMLYVSADCPTPKCIQGAYVKMEELEWAISLVKGSKHDLSNKFVIPEVEVSEMQSDNSCNSAITDVIVDETQNKELAKIIMWTLSQQKVSANKLTDEFSMGNRSYDIMDKLCSMNIVSEQHSKQPRNVIPTCIDNISPKVLELLSKYGYSRETIAKAGAYYKDKKFHYAAAVYMSLGDYSDSKDKVEEIYKKCLDYIEKEKYTEAIPILENLKDYKNSESKMEEIYNKALKLVEDKKYDKAIKILEKFGKYKESESKLNEITELQNKEKYNKAVKLGKDEKYDDAIKLFEELGDYSDSKSKIAEMKKKRDADTYEMKGTTAWVKIDNGYLNVRKTAISDATSVGELYNGDEVTIQATSSNGKWYKITSGSITGYCSVDYISTSKPIANITGSWIETEINQPHFMEITSIEDNYFYVEIHCDGDNFTWTFSGEYDYKTGFLEYNDGICTTKYDGTTTQNTNLIGTLSYSNRYIYWSFPANSNRIEFERN